MKKGRQEGRKEGRQEGRKEGIFAMISLLTDMNVSHSDIIQSISDKFDLTQNLAEEYVNDFRAEKGAAI